jgi:hypothetical protein
MAVGSAVGGPARARAVAQKITPKAVEARWPGWIRLALGGSCSIVRGGISPRGSWLFGLVVSIVGRPHVAESLQQRQA